MAREQGISPTTALIGLQGQLDAVRSEIFTTNTNLQNIGTLIQNDTFEDQRRLLEEREQERTLLERKVRTGQEEDLQQKVSSSLLPPVVKLENKLNSTFSKISTALLSLFGFFGTKVIQGIQTSAKLGLGALKGIGDVLKGSFGFIANTLGMLSRGFTSVLSGIAGITGKVIRALGTLAASPFKAIADLVGKLLPGLRGGAIAAGAGAGVAAAGSTLFGILGIGSRISTGTDAITSFREGDIAGGSINAAATVLPSPIFAMGLTGLKLGGIDLKSITSGVTSGFSQASESLKSFDIMNPFSPENREALSGALSGFNFNAPAREAQVSVQPGSTTSGPIALTVTPYPYNGDIQSLKNKQTPPGTEPEAKPDVVYLRSDQNQQTSSVSGNIPTLTDVPLIPSANPDNFYTVYAQLNYNVVL